MVGVILILSVTAIARHVFFVGWLDDRLIGLLSRNVCNERMNIAAIFCNIIVFLGFLLVCVKCVECSKSVECAQ
jgi:hypothetical protein